MNYILYDPEDIENFYPFTLTRPLCQMRVFGGTIKEHWEKYLGCSVSVLTRHHLTSVYPTQWDVKENTFINSKYLPIENIENEELFQNFSDRVSLEFVQNKFSEDILPKHIIKSLFSFQSNLDIISQFQSYTTIFKSNIDCSKNILFDDKDGPIYIEKNVTIMPGVMIKGPVHICEGATIKMGAKIYGPTVIGPYCKVGGEVSSSIFLGYSNKAHDGFLGNSIIGEWCNIGAGTSTSNLKNDYGSIKMWNYHLNKFEDSGQQFLGLFMGDHTKCAINTSFNTGTTVGVNCNIFGVGFHRNFINSFSWGGSQGFKKYDFKKAINVAEKVMSRRNHKLTKEYISMLKFVYEM
ncbi:MAG: glucose-1-phosphate thymidylyltransferase [Flavobacteriales bacterium TMED191]|nr:MAG: glucose-1-phosphate thymidylyltransferase [Flavobacteriales bacterium TMED191]